MTDFLKTVLPWIGAAATGGVPALVGMAARTVGDALNKDIKDSAEAIAAAVSGATPEQMAALKKADQEFQLKMQALGFEHEQQLEKIEAEDRASAREREKTLRDWTPTILAIGVSIGFFSTLGYMIQSGVPKEGGDALLVMLGSLGTAWTGIIAYYFGSSRSSEYKNNLIAGLRK
jgi:hypothetical protein